MGDIEIKLVSHGNALITGLIPLCDIRILDILMGRTKVEFARIGKPQDWLRHLMASGAQRLWLVFYHHEEPTSRGVLLTNKYGIEVEYASRLELWLSEPVGRDGIRHAEFLHREPLDSGRPFLTGTLLFEATPLQVSLRNKDDNFASIQERLLDSLREVSDFTELHAPEWKPWFDGIVLGLLSPPTERKGLGDLLPAQGYSPEVRRLLAACREALTPIGDEIPFNDEGPVFAREVWKSFCDLRSKMKEIATLGELATVNSINR